MEARIEVDQVLDITIGGRTDNKVFRAQVARMNGKEIVLHVPGFDPLHFVDLLKGTEVVLRASRGEERMIARSKMTRHFKNTSPYLLVRRPDGMRPIRRTAVAVFSRKLDIEYAPLEGHMLRRSARNDGSSLGTIVLRSVPEPFDVGTPLEVRVRRAGGAPVILEGHVAGISTDGLSGRDEARYEILYAIDKIAEEHVAALFGMLISPPEERSESDSNGDEGRGL